jgi:hypothetical protein
MPHRLYVRCQDCRDAPPGSPCAACDGERFVPAGITRDDLEQLRRMSRKLLRLGGSIYLLAAADRP